jgi:hypothetical protein
VDALEQLPGRLAFARVARSQRIKLHDVASEIIAGTTGRTAKK